MINTRMNCRTFYLVSDSRERRKGGEVATKGLRSVGIQERIGAETKDWSTRQISESGE